MPRTEGNRRITLPRMIRYGTASLLSAAVDVLCFIFLSRIVFRGMPDLLRLFWSTVGARITSSLCNFFLNHFLVFGRGKNVKSSLVRYYVLWGCMLSSSYLLMLGGTQLLPWPEWMVKLLGDALLGIVCYQVQRHWVFPRKTRREVKI